MTAWTLVILACLAGKCAEHELFLDGLSPIQGVATAQAIPHAARWSFEHPRLEIRRWTLVKGIGA